MASRLEFPNTRAFSLVELSIVLVILGLLVGGVLSGKSLIEAATIRSQIAQVDTYRVAARAFKDKYFALPGDLPEPTASQAGFAPRGPYAGEGDGDGVIQGIHTHVANNANALYQAGGETVLFWADLSKAGLIPGSFTKASATVPGYLGGSIQESGTPNISRDFFPQAKITGNYVYVGGSPVIIAGVPQYNPNAVAIGKNYFFLSRMAYYSSSLGLLPDNSSGDYGLKVSQAYAIDAKVDDGAPATGKIIGIVTHPNVTPVKMLAWHYGGYLGGANMPASATSCTDNNNNAAANPPQYSMSVDNGDNKNCMLVMEM